MPGAAASQGWTGSTTLFKTQKPIHEDKEGETGHDRQVGGGKGAEGFLTFCCSLLQHCRAGARAASRQDGSETSVAVLADCSHTQSLLYQRHNTVPGTHKKLRKKYDSQNVFIHCNYSSFLLTPLTQYSTHKLRKL